MPDRQETGERMDAEAADSNQTTNSQPSGIPTSMELFLAFSRIGLTSFGGGLSGWLLREFVQRRKWLDEEEFLTGLGLAQAFPGVNVVNLAIWIGFRLRGTMGALAGMAGIVVPAAVLVVLIGAAFGLLIRYPLTHLVLDGVGAAAIGLSLQMGLIAARRAAAKGAWQIGVMVLAFVSVGLLHFSMPIVVLVLGAAGVALAYRDLSRA
jgi:chromate transporter